MVRIRQLRALGVKVDGACFGTDCSSLSLLRRLPIDSLKIARMFVGGLDTDATDTAIVSLGRALGLGLIAEGMADLPPSSRPRSNAWDASSAKAATGPRRCVRAEEARSSGCSARDVR